VDRMFAAGRRYAALICGIGFASVAILGTVYNLVATTSAKAGLNTYLLDESAVRQLAMEQTSSIALLQARLPERARVLLVGEAAVFDAQFDLQYNTVFDFELLQDWATEDPLSLYKEDIPLKSREEILAALHEHGITHVFVNWMEILRYREYGSYTYTDFISPRTMRKLVELGVVEPIELAPQERLALYEALDGTKRQELDAWAPELRATFRGEPVVEAYELYKVPAQ
jgi:hypothetical protein